MKKKSLIWSLATAFVVIVALLFILFTANKSKGDVRITYPFNKALFPPEFPAPTFTWHEENNETKHWQVSLETKNGRHTVSEMANGKEWRPNSKDWENIKALSNNKDITFTLKGIAYNDENDEVITSNQKIKFSISQDEVGAPILYREIPLPFAFAEKYPDSMSFRLVNVGSADPPHYAMKKVLVCGNCHSFSNDGQTIGIDFDAVARDKGGFFIGDIDEKMIFDTSNYMSWNKIQDRFTFGMFSKLSPDGRYVITTLKDRVIFEEFGFGFEAIPFSQFFFPVNGVLAVYDRQTEKVWELEGANDTSYVQSNAFWSPDGKTIIYARAKALPFGEDKNEIIIDADDNEIVQEFIDGKKDFKFDIYTIPFNDGKGGEPKPLKGASNNGMSNYFPVISPDGKWVVFTQAENFMLLRPDSKLFIVPFEGGKAKALECNFQLLNSWHTWSPNGHWIAYSSKGMSVYTDLFLTHIDDKGRSSIPVLVETARVNGRAVNYPEFVNRPSDYEFTMVYNYVNIDHIQEAMRKRDTTMAIQLYDKYIEQDQYSLVSEYIFLASFNIKIDRFADGLKFINAALEKEPNNSEAIYLKETALRYMKN